MIETQTKHCKNCGREMSSDSNSDLCLSCRSKKSKKTKKVLNVILFVPRKIVGFFK